MAGRLIRTAPGAEPPRWTIWPVTHCCTSPVRSSWSVNGWPPPPERFRATRLAAPPAPGWPGYRGAPANAARWRPVRCPTCCPAAGRSTTRRRASRPPRRGTTRLPDAAGRDTAAILAAAVPANWARCSSAASRSPTCPTPPRAGRDRRRTVRGQPGTAGKRGHRPRRRGVPGRAGGGEGRLIRQLGGPNSTVRGRAAHQRRAGPAGATLPGRRDRRRPRSAHRGGRRRENSPASACGRVPAGNAAPTTPPTSQPGRGEAVLAGWRMLLDARPSAGRRAVLAGTARPPVVRLSAATAAEIGAAEQDLITVGTPTVRSRCRWPHRHGRSRRVAAAELGGLGGHEQLSVTVGAVVSIGRAEL